MSVQTFETKRNTIWPNSFYSTGAQTAIVLLFATLLILPIWSVKYPPLVDYPNHLARAFILYHLNDPNYQFGRYYAADWGVHPYCFADFLVQVFQHFVGIYAAGRLLLTVCILGLPLSVAFFLRRANPGNEYLALWALAVAYNPNFLMGFMSFVLSIALCFVTVGLWLDYMRTGQPKYWAATLVFATVTYLTHLGGFAVAGLTIPLYTLVATGIGKRLLTAVLLFVPGGSFFLYEKLHGWAGRSLDYSTWTFNSKWRGMLVPYREYTRFVEGFTILALMTTVVYFLWRRQHLRIHAIWIPVVLAILAIHWMLPGAYGELGLIDYRFCIFAFLFGLAVPSFAGPRTIPIALATTVFLLHAYQAESYFASEQKHLSSVAKGFQYIPPNALVLAYTAQSHAAWERCDDMHFWGYGVIERGWITPSVFHQRGVQPLQLRVPMYSDDDQYGGGLIEQKYALDLIGQSYDYLWAANISYLDPLLDKIADPILSQGSLKIFQVKAVRKLTRPMRNGNPDR